MVRFHGLLYQIFYHIILLMTSTQEFTIQVQSEDPKKKEKEILLMTSTQEFTIQVQSEDPKKKEKEKPVRQTLFRRFLKTVK
jgi:hypothetical protein